MPIPTSILLYGRDAHLHETRQWVLEACGYQVCAASDLPGLTPVLALNNFDLLILCHSLSMEECGRALALTSMKSLILSAGSPANHAQMLSSVCVTMDGPAKLISAIDPITYPGSGIYSHTF